MPYFQRNPRKIGWNSIGEALSLLKQAEGKIWQLDEIPMALWMFTMITVGHMVANLSPSQGVRLDRPSSGWYFQLQWEHWEASPGVSESCSTGAIFLLYFFPWESYSSRQSRPTAKEQDDLESSGLWAWTCNLRKSINEARNWSLKSSSGKAIG